MQQGYLKNKAGISPGSSSMFLCSPRTVQSIIPNHKWLHIIAAPCDCQYCHQFIGEETKQVAYLGNGLSHVDQC